MTENLCGQCWKPIDSNATECENCGFVVNPEKRIEDHRATLFKHIDSGSPQPEHKWEGSNFAFLDIIKDPENSTNIFFRSSNAPSSMMIVLSFIALNVIRLLFSLFLFDLDTFDFGSLVIFTDRFVILISMLYILLWGTLLYGLYFLIGAIASGLMGDNFPIGSQIKLNFSAKMRDYIGHLFYTPFLVLLIIQSVSELVLGIFHISPGQTFDLIFNLGNNIVWITTGYLFFKGFRGKIGYVGRFPLVVFGIILLLNVSGIYYSTLFF